MQVNQALAHQTVSRPGGRVDVLQPHLAASHRLAIPDTGDHDLPQLLGAALLDRLGNHIRAPTRRGHRKSVTLVTPTASCPRSLTAWQAPVVAKVSMPAVNTPPWTRLHGRWASPLEMEP